MSRYQYKEEYKNGAEGFILWAEDNVYVEITPFDSTAKKWVPIGELPDDKHPETGKSYREMWEAQKEIIREALRMENGQFKYRLIIFCWPRGEGKSLDVCLIKIWRFVVFPRQKILCGANSRDQVQFVHYDVIRDIIKNSPKLVNLIGLKNIKEKGTTITDKLGNVQSELKPISSHTGLLSNINGYTFSDLYKMKKSTFFTELDGSTRWIPNAMGAIDSTVSPKNHILHDLYQAYIKGEDETLFFSYRFSKEGKPEDYWNPNATAAQLNGFRVKFPFGDFEKFFLNLWESAGERFFTPEIIEAMRYIGFDKAINMQNAVIEAITTKNKLYEQKIELAGSGIQATVETQIQEIKRRLWPIESVYKLRTKQNQPKMAEASDLESLSDIFDTNWSIIGALDRAQPGKTRTSARTIIGAVMKGLIGSRGNPFIASDGEAPEYIYILIHLANIEDHSLEGMKNQLQLVHNEFNGLDMLGSETWGAFDLKPWCEERAIGFDVWTATYDRQKVMFAELFNAAKFGRFKVPPLAVAGYKNDDIFEEEAEVFDHDPPAAGKKAGFFGSPEKELKNGVQDDVIYMLGGAIYAGRELSVVDFRERKGNIDFGTFFPAEGLLGDYRR